MCAEIENFIDDNFSIEEAEDFIALADNLSIEDVYSFTDDKDLHAKYEKQIAAAKSLASILKSKLSTNKKED